MEIITKTEGLLGTRFYNTSEKTSEYVFVK